MRLLSSAVLLLTLSAGASRADRLILHDGREFVGRYERIRDTYRLRLPHGGTVAFPKQDVKRAVFESRLAADEVRALLHEFAALVRPALEAEEPFPFAYLTEVIAHTEQAAARSLRADFGVALGVARVDHHSALAFDGFFDASAARTDFAAADETVFGARRDRAVDGVFVDLWARYTGEFEALAQDVRYRALTDPRKGSRSLTEFARFAPAGQEELAKAVRVALDAVADSIARARDTQARVRAIPLRQVNHEEAVRRLSDKAARANRRVDTARDPEKQLKAAARAEDRLRRRVTRMIDEMRQITATAERKISDFARQRGVARGHLETALRLVTRP